MALVRYADMGLSATASVFPAPPLGPNCYRTDFKNSS
jgi:hypothetical protein